MRIVSALREFIFDEEEYRRVKQALMEAAFNDGYLLELRE